MATRVVLAVALGGCASLIQRAPPAKPWQAPRQSCDASDAHANVAALLALGFAVGGVIRYATADSGLIFADEELQGVGLVGIGVVFAVDAINASRQARLCREYQSALPERPIAIDPDKL